MREKTYYLDLPTLVSYIRGKAGVLRATVTLAKNQPACQGIIFLLQANISQSYILSSSGALLFEGDKAYTRLSQNKEWQVRIDSEQVIEQEWLAWLQQQRLAPPLPALAAPAVIPRPKRALNAPFPPQFSAQQAFFLRTVFALANGQRTVEQIKECLPHLSPQAIDDALNVLRTLGLIE